MGEAVDWLTSKGSWINNGANLDVLNDHIIDTSSPTKLAAGTAATTSTSGSAWKGWVDVDHGNLIAGLQQATGEGLKNGLEAFNLDKLVTSGTGSAATFCGFDYPGSGQITRMCGANIVGIHDDHGNIS